MPDEIPTLGPLERQVMEILWDCPEDVCTRDVLDRTSQPLAYTTIATVLNNLAGKGLVEKIAMGRMWGYRPRVSRSQYTAEIMAQALATSADRSGSLLHFVGSIPADDLAVLRGLLDRDQAGR